jgi:hypothetical protein
MEEIYQRKKEERQKKLIEGLENLKLDNYNNNTKNQLKSKNNNKSNNNIIINDNTSSNNDEDNNNDDNISENNNSVLNKKEINQFNINEQKIKQLTDIIAEKNKEIETLKKINEENIAIFNKQKEFSKTITTKELVGKENYDLLHSEEANMMAKTMHKTVKVLQEMLKQKTLEINEKNKIIENLQNELGKSKSVYLQQINILKDQIQDRNSTALNELQKFLDENKLKMNTKTKRREINSMTLNELEKLLADKDNEIRALNEELRASRIENKKSLETIAQKNKKIMGLEDSLKEEKLKIESIQALNKYNHENFIAQLQEEIKLKNEMIEREKEKIAEHLGKISNDKYPEQIFSGKEDDNDNKNMQSQKYAQSVQLTDEEESKEKIELKKQIKN